MAITVLSSSKERRSCANPSVLNLLCLSSLELRLGASICVRVSVYIYVWVCVCVYIYWYLCA